MQMGLRVGPQDMASIGGLAAVRSARQVLADDAQEAARLAADTAAQRPQVQGLVALARQHWSQAREAKQSVQARMMRALNALRGEYDPQVLAEIRAQGGSEIYMMLFATKARQAKALLGDVILGLADDKPWSLRHTPVPQLPEAVAGQIMQAVHEAVLAAENSPQPLELAQVRQMLRDAKMQAEAELDKEARVRCQRAERKLNDILLEGGFVEALDGLLDNLMVFPTVFLKGPVVRMRGTLTWQPGADGAQPVVQRQPMPHWEAVSPLDIFPAPYATSTEDGYLFERHRLSLQALHDMIGVQGYNDAALREVIRLAGQGSLSRWIEHDLDSTRDAAEGRTHTWESTELVDALQYWGDVTGQMLLEWGMDTQEVPDPARVYAVELWLIDRHVIKAVINPDPLARRPYFTCSYKRVPGAFWHLSLYDTMSDCQDMCNAAARALANNMGIASGPQVWVNIDRMARNEDVTTLFPWKITQFGGDPMGSSAPPMGFFQPSSNANELIGVMERFSVLADECTGIPRYMTGDGSAGGAGRTASGMSMMVGNAGKTIKNLVSSIDIGIIAPAVRRGYEFIMRYIPDEDLKGDLQVVARGALSLMNKDAAQVRRNEFLAMVVQNPHLLELIGKTGLAELVRSLVRTLDLDAQDIVPLASEIAMQQMAQAQQMQAMQQLQMAQQMQGQPPAQTAPQAAAPQGPTASAELLNGAPVVDHFGK